MNALFNNSPIRRATEADLPRLVEICRARYGERVTERTLEQNLNWGRWKLRDANSVVLLGEHSLGVAGIIYKYGSEKRATLDLLATLEGHSIWEPYLLVKAMIRWAAFQGATGAFRIDADTGVDFGPFAKRLGGVEVDPRKYPRYDIPLSGGTL